MKFGSLEILLLTILFENILLIAIFWKDIMQYLLPQEFYWIEINMPDGTKQTNKVWKGFLKNYKFKKNKKTYEIQNSFILKNGSKYLEYQYANSIPLNTLKPRVENLNLLLKDEKLKVWNLFKEPENPIMALLKMLAPFIMGAIFGALAMAIHAQSLGCSLGG